MHPSHLFRHLAYEGPRHAAGPPMCPGPSDRAQRITRRNIADGRAVCVACHCWVPVQHDPTGWGGAVLAPHPLPETDGP